MGKFDGILLISDYDQTLRGTSRTDVSKENLDAVSYFVSNGGTFTICTGRDLASYLTIKHKFSVNAPVILSNGSVIYDTERDQIIFEEFMPEEIYDDIPRYMELFPTCGIELHRGKRVNILKRNAGTDRTSAADAGLIDYIEMDRSMKIWTVSIYTVSHPIGYAEELEPMLEEVNKKYTGFRARGMIDVSKKGVTKGTGAIKLCELLRVDREKMYCAGDSWNDIPMLKEAKTGFAPKNSAEAVLRSGVTVVRDSDEHAVEHIIEILDTMY